MEKKNNVACSLFKEQINLINELPLEDRPKVLYLSVMNAFNQFEIQNDNQFEIQNEDTYISLSLSLSNSISKYIVDLLSKNITFKEYSNNYGGKREKSGRKSKTITQEKKVKENKPLEELKHYGEFKHVCLTESKYNELYTLHGDLFLQAIEKLDGWLDRNKNKKLQDENHRAYFKSNSWVWENLKQPALEEKQDAFFEEIKKEQDERLGIA